MYENPITRSTEDIMRTVVKIEEGYLIEAVHKVGFDINKEELAKALRYDRDQYEKGFNDGHLAASPKWIPITESLPELGIDVLTVNGYGEYEINNVIDEDGKWYWEPVTAWMPLPAPWKGRI